MWDSFPQFLWQPAEEPPFQTVRDQVTVVEETGSNKATPGKTQSPPDDQETPYSNYPLTYKFSQGPPSKVHYICDFLQDRISWQHVIQLPTYSPCKSCVVKQVTPPIRDMISAKVHGLLYKALDQHPLAILPQSFPPSETIEYLLHAYDKRFSGLYPIIPPTLFRQLTSENEDLGADPGILLTIIMCLGCLVSPVPKVRMASVQLAYLLRTSIHERTWRDETYLLDTAVITSWILITIFSAWSGDRRHSMNAEAYQSVFTAVS